MIPNDISEAYSMLKTLLYDLPDIMIDEVKEWMGALREDYRIWKGGGKEPDWQNFREWMNEICAEDAMPKLFV
jgi:hypothetical protein